MTGRRILVAAERSAGEVSTSTLEVLGAARKLIDGSGTVTAVCLGMQLDDAAASRLTAHGAHRVILVDDPVFDCYQADSWVHELTSVARELDPDLILLPHSIAGAELAPRLAIRLNGSVVTACSAVDLLDDVIHWTRACYGGAARQVVSLHASPMIATLAPKAFEPAGVSEHVVVPVERRSAVTRPEMVRAHVVAKSELKTAGARLETAKVVVAGGRGLGGPDGFVILGELAGYLGAAVGASRVACDLGWCPASWQVGLSGKTIAPDLYFAFGISGAPHHLAGCGNARVIVAVNTDRDAQIFKSAKFAVVADCAEFIPALAKEVRRLHDHRTQPARDGNRARSTPTSSKH